MFKSTFKHRIHNRSVKGHVNIVTQREFANRDVRNCEHRNLKVNDGSVNKY